MLKGYWFIKRVIKHKGFDIFRSDIIFNLQKILSALKIEVKILSLYEFQEEFMRHFQDNKEAQIINEKVPQSFIHAGKSSPGIVAINFDSIIRDILQFEDRNNIELSLNGILCILFIAALHEYGESKFNYKHCDDEKCPMFPDQPFARSEPLLWPYSPCKNHTELNRYLSHPIIAEIKIQDR